MKTITIGRDTSNDVVIEDDYVSGQHVSISFDGAGHYLLHDLNSSNGTYVNGQRVGEIALQIDDVVKIGNTILPWQSYFKDVSAMADQLHGKVIFQIPFGRQGDNAIVLANETVSAQHAVIHVTNQNEYLLQDLNSSNGTFVNDQRITTVLLSSTDKVRLADASIDWREAVQEAIKKSMSENKKERKDHQQLRVFLSIAAAVLVFLGIVLSYKHFIYDKQTNKNNPLYEDLDLQEDLSGLQDSTPNKFTELVAQVEKSIFLIEARNYIDEIVGTGTGFFVTEEGLAVSNNHIFMQGSNWRIKTIDGSIYEIEKRLVENSTSDYIIFQIHNPKQELFPYLKAAKKLPRKGDNIFVIGNPKGIESTLTTGIVSALRGPDGVEAGSTFIQFDAAISPGSSGSPVMNMRGDVVGIATLKIIDGENLNFAINIKLLKDELERLQYH